MDNLEQLKRELEEQTRLAEERLTQIRYLQSDFDNYRKWSNREKEAVTEFANAELIKDLLVILDDLEQALPSLNKEENRQGMLMIQKKLAKILKSYGLEPIECVGKTFDPNLHEVICKELGHEKPNTILEDIGKGYMLKSKVIRPSKVKVAEQKMENEGD